MKDIDKYITEKFKISKDIENIDDYSSDARRFKKNDILFSNPNISHGLKKSGRPGLPSFYKVTDTDKKRVKIAPIGNKLVSGDRKNGECIPDDNVVYKDSWLKIDNDGLIYYGGNVIYLWDGTPEKFYN